MQIGDAGVRVGFNRFAYFFHHRVVHFTVEQDLAGVGQQTAGPYGDQHRADQSHHRV